MVVATGDLLEVDAVLAQRRAAELDRSGEPTGNSPELTRDDDAWRHPPPRMPAEPSPDEKAPEAGAPPAPALPAERPPSPVERREAIRHGPTIKPIGTGIQRRR